MWTDVYDFHPKTLGLATKGIGFRYVRLLQGVRAPSRRNTILLGGWEIDEQALADLLNAARERWLSADPEGPRTDIPRPRPTLIGAMTGPRINRKAYWLVVISVLAVAFASSYIPGLSRGIAPVVTLLFVRVFASRLHDFGRSGWWQLGLYGIQIPAVILLATAGNQPANVVLGAGLLIQLVFVTVIGAIPGDREANRFGQPLGEPSPIAASEVFR